MKLHYIVPACIILSASMTSNAELSLGVGVGASTKIYKEYDTSFSALPLVSFEKNGFYINSLSTGYIVAEDDHNEITLGVYYYALRFKPSNTDNIPMKQLKRRRDSIMGNFGYSHSQDWGTLRGNFSFDIMDRSNAMLVDIGYFYPLPLSMQWTIKPGVGVNWASQKHNRYYFGVSAAESVRSGLSTYKPSDSWSYYAEVNNHFAFTDSWAATLIARATMFSDEIKDSPMVVKRYNATLLAGVSYTF